MIASSTYRLGTSTWADTLATWWHLKIRNATRELSTARKLRIAKYVDLRANPRILEIGPSAGVVTSASLCQLQQDLTLFDTWGYHKQWAMLAAANPRLKCVFGDANQPLPFQDALFDSCIFMAAISYMASPVDVLREIHRVMKVGGHLFVTATRPPATNRAHELGRIDQSQPTFLDRNDLDDAMGQAGFEVVESYNYMYYPGVGYDAFRTLSKFRYSEAMHRVLAARHPNKEIFACCIARRLPS